MAEGGLAIAGKGEQGNRREKHVAEIEENVSGKSKAAWGPTMQPSQASPPWAGWG